MKTKRFAIFNSANISRYQFAVWIDKYIARRTIYIAWFKAERCWTSIRICDRRQSNSTAILSIHISRLNFQNCIATIRAVVNDTWYCTYVLFSFSIIYIYKHLWAYITIAQCCHSYMHFCQKKQMKCINESIYLIRSVEVDPRLLDGSVLSNQFYLGLLLSDRLWSFQCLSWWCRASGFLVGLFLSCHWPFQAWRPSPGIVSA